MPETILECPQCGMAVIGGYVDLFNHYKDEHPLQKLIVSEDDSQTEWEKLFLLAVKEQHKVGFSPFQKL